MAVITVDAAKVAPIDPGQSEIYPMVPAAAVARGDVAYLDSNGKAAAASGAAAGTTKTTGIVLESAGVRQGVSVLRRGKVAGFDVSGMAYGALVYLSDTAGKLDTAAGTVSVVVGKVVPMSDSDLTKVLYFEPSWLT